MGQLEDAKVFIRIVEAGSITKASEQLGIAKSAVSKKLNDLETRLAAKLIHRTTRQSHLTEVGSAYYEKMKIVIDEVTEIDQTISQQEQLLSGPLKISTPLTFGLSHLTQSIDLFLQEHPNLTMHIDYSDQMVNLVEDGVDLAIRIGVLKDSSLQARKITPITHKLCASPDYLAQAGEPTTIAALKKHRFLLYSNALLHGIPLVDKNQQSHQVYPNAQLMANNGDALRQMAIAGHGVIFSPTFIVWEAIAKGELKVIMEDYTLPVIHAYAVYPKTRFLPKKVRVLIDFLVQRFGEHPYWDQGKIIYKS
ncbi:LysR family transcriptional regulator [Marinomonas agarivorans]|nr:LysR family transcriptional regulator [Marinomonas agarivorans]